jgi:hypothetical protein
MSSRSRFYLSEITPDDLVEFRASWDWDSNVTRQKAQTNLKSFLRAACPNSDTLVKALGKISLTEDDNARLEPKPFTERELTTLLTQVEYFPKKPFTNG